MPIIFFLFFFFGHFLSMKKLLLVLGILALLAPTETQAAAAVSPYVRSVLERADKGIAKAKLPADQVLMDLATNSVPWTGQIAATVLMLRDTKLRIVAEQRGLTENTACLHLDALLIQMKMVEVVLELKAAVSFGNFTAISRLQDLLMFLNERLEIFLGGARDPTVTDTTWYQVRSFDPDQKSFCCTPDAGNLCRESNVACPVGDLEFNTKAGCVAYGCFGFGTAPEPKLCPFDTDYLPPSVLRGYGCDVEALEDVLKNATLPTFVDATKEEKDALKKLQDLLKKHLDLARKYLSIEEQLNRILGRATPLLPRIPERRHTVVTGCTDQWAKNIDTDRDGWPDGALKWELRGPFTLERDERKILNAFEELRLKEANRRPIPSVFDPSKRKRPKDVMAAILDDDGIAWFKVFSRNQAVAESEIYAQSSDPHQAIREATKTLRASVAALARLARDPEGLRGFVRDFAYYLRRSCISRPCSTRLDQILKIVFKDSCFPYTDGQYLTGTGYEQCKKDAGLEDIP